MARQKNRLVPLIMDYETTFGTSPTSKNGIKLNVYPGGGFKAKRNYIEEEIMTGYRNDTRPQLSNLDITGSFEIPIDKAGIYYWLKLALGAPTKTGTGPYTYAFKVGDSQLSAVFQQPYSQIPTYVTYNGCMVSKITITIEPKAALKMSIELIATKETVDAAAYDDTPVEIVLDYFTLKGMSVKEGGSALVGVCTKLSIEIDFGLNGDDTETVDSNGEKTGIAEGRVKVRGSATLFFDSITLYNKAVNATETSLEAKLVSGADSFTITIPELIFEHAGLPTMEAGGFAKLELPIYAFYHNDAGASIIKFELVTSQNLT